MFFCKMQKNKRQNRCPGYMEKQKMGRRHSAVHHFAMLQAREEEKMKKVDERRVEIDAKWEKMGEEEKSKTG